VIVGIGIDLVEIPRVERMLEGKGNRMLARLFTDDELAGTDEARMIGWREVEVIPREGRSPALLLHGRAERRALELDVRHTWISLSHTDITASAVVVLEGP
jgi:holo-[acyl-carrier protein] synthase